LQCVIEHGIKKVLFFMGASYGIPVQEPMWFSYYGPIRQNDENDTLDQEIETRLQEFGIGTTIPIRSQKAKELIVPVALNSPAFLSCDENSVVISFAATLAGEMEVSTETFHEKHSFEPGMKNFEEFKRPKEEKWSVSFHFVVDTGVSSRIYTLQVQSSGFPIVIDDRIVVDGETSVVSRVFRPQLDADAIEPDEEDDICLICCTEKATVVALPCRHCCMCRSCSERFASVSCHCPFCRTIVQELIEWVPENNEF